MNRLGAILLPIIFGTCLSNCTTTSAPVAAAKPAMFSIGKGDDSITIPQDGRIRVRTTAYTHTEADSLPYGKKSAAGNTLKYGAVKSAAADWSRFPLGTMFKIDGDSSIYHVDDYGSALVGTNTIDIYKPSKTAMNHWGVRHVDIKILKWGSFDRSANLLKDRTRYNHVRRMANDIASTQS